MQYFANLSRELVDGVLKCSVCTEFLKDPVSPSCGHTYCRSCITKHQARSEHGESACPKCWKISGACSVLHTNIHAAELVEKFKPESHSSAEIMETEDEELRHCQKHYQSLDMSCKTDQAAICKECAVTDHKEHKKQYIKVSEIYLVVNIISDLLLYTTLQFHQGISFYCSLLAFRAFVSDLKSPQYSDHTTQLPE